MARKKGKYVSQQGVALLAAAMAIAITGVLVKEFSTNTTVDWFAAVNTRDNMRAELLARSGANLSQMVLRVQRDLVDRYAKQFGLGDLQITDYVSYFTGAFSGKKDEVAAVADMIGGIDTENVKGLGVEFGDFDIVITSEDGRINVNCAAGSQASREHLKTKLEALIWFEHFDPIFENADAEGWRRDRQQQVAAIMDYIDKDKSKYDAPGNPEDYGYESLRDDYKAKDESLDSIGEIKLIRGIDDRFWSLFGDNLTIYGDCKDNIGAITDPKQIAAIIVLAAKNPDDPVVNDPMKLWALARRVAEARAMGVYFDSAQAFADFVKDPNGAMMGGLLGATAGQQAAGGTGAMGDSTTPVEGVELDVGGKLNQIVKDGPRRIYKVEVTATAGRVRRVLTAIWDNKTVNQNVRNPQDYGQGSWVFWRLE